MPKDLRGVEIEVGDLLYHPMQNGCASPLISLKRVIEIAEGRLVRVVHDSVEAASKDRRRFSTIRFPSRCVVDRFDREQRAVLSTES